MACQHLQRLLTACAVLLVVLAGTPPVAADQPPPLRPSESQLAPAVIDDGDDVRLVDEAVRAESCDREGISIAALIPASSDPATQRTGLAGPGPDGRCDRSASRSGSPRAPPPGV